MCQIQLDKVYLEKQKYNLRVWDHSGWCFLCVEVVNTGLTTGQTYGSDSGWSPGSCSSWSVHTGSSYKENTKKNNASWQHFNVLTLVSEVLKCNTN